MANPDADIPDEGAGEAEETPFEPPHATPRGPAAAAEEENVQILYGDNGHPILLIVNGRQYVVGQRGRGTQQPQLTQPPPQAKKQQPSQSNRLWVACNVLLVIVVVGAFHLSGGSPVSIAVPKEVFDWVCAGNLQAVHSSSDDPLSSSSMVYRTASSVCMCDPGSNSGQLVTTFAEWPLHTPETFDVAGWKEGKGTRFVTDKEIASRVFDLVIQSLAAHASTTEPFLCMHHLSHGRPFEENARVCVLSRGRGGGNNVFPLYNLDLKGYSNESTTLPETSVVCGATPLLFTRTRRLVVDVAYTTASGIHMRSLIDDPKEASAIQRIWEEFRGTYAC